MWGSILIGVKVRVIEPKELSYLARMGHMSSARVFIDHEPRTFGKLKGLQFNHILCDCLSNKNKVVPIEYDIFGILFHKR